MGLDAMFSLRAICGTKSMAPAMGMLAPANLTLVRWKSKNAAGSAGGSGKSPGKRLGPKKLGSHYVKPGMIIMRQRGERYKAGVDVGMGRDHTIYALKEGRVKYTKTRTLRRRGKPRFRKFISVHNKDSDGSEIDRWTAQVAADYAETIKNKKKGLVRMTKPRALRIVAKSMLLRKGDSTKIDDYPGGWKQVLRDGPMVILPKKLPLMPKARTPWTKFWERPYVYTGGV